MNASSESNPLVYIARSSLEVEAVFGQRLSRLSRKGFDIHVLAGRDGGGPKLRERGFAFQPIPVSRRWNIPGLAAAFPIIQGYLLDLEPLLVHSYGDLLALLGSFAATQADAQAIFSTIYSHTFTPTPIPVELDRISTISDAWSRKLEVWLNEIGAASTTNASLRFYNYLGNLVDKYITTNRHDLGILNETELIDSEKLEILIGGQGIELEEFDPDNDDIPNTEEVRTRLEINQRYRKLIGFRGEGIAREGLPELRELIKRISAESPSTGWLIQITNESNREYFERWSRQFPVKMVSSSFDTALFYRGIDLYVDPGKEGANTSEIMKASAMKTPPIAFNFPGRRAVIREGQTGKLIPPGQIENFKDVILELLQNPKKRQNLSIRTRGRAVHHFDRRYIDDQIIRLYDSTLEQKLEP